ncbi:hypothetical protein J7E55_25910 [Bacillus sp. ISL-53]|nr:hypothetical protein [Bacillus sp. ISL-53]
MKRVFTVVGLSLALVGCGIAVDDKPMKEAEKTVAEQPAHSEEEKMVNEYANELRPLINNLIENGDELRVMLNIATEDRDVLYTADYHETIQFICDDMQDSVEALRAIGAQEDKELGIVHKSALLGANELEFIAQEFPDAILSQDMDRLGEFAESFVKAGTYLDEATNKLNKVSEER